MQQIPVNNNLCISNNLLCTQSATHVAVHTRREALADWVRQQMTLGERDWSTHEVSRRAKAGGYTLSNGTVQNVLNVRHKGNISEATLRAFAHVFGVPPAEVFAIYHGTAVEEVSKIRNERLATLAVDAERLSLENVPKFDALIDYVQHTVRQMIKEQEREAPGKQRRAPRVIYGDGALPEEKKRKRA